ncbi:MAG: phosphoserine transaminase [Hyphomicrobiaceae bacterium]
MTDLPRPPAKPARPYFSSGPCVKRPGWNPESLQDALLGRSHRAKPGKARLAEAATLTHRLLGLPKDYRVGIMPASDTGAFEAAMWSMLGARGIEVLAWESFGSGWANDIVKELRLEDVRLTEAAYGALPDLSNVDFSRDVIFTWNGTTSGVRVPDGRWIPDDRQGLTFADATSAAFAQRIDWPKVDVATFSFQKALGGEAQHGVLILSPRAVQRLENFAPKRPIPKIFRLAKAGKLIQGIFEGETINTPSMLVIEDYLDALRWAESIGGHDKLVARADANAAVVDRWVAKTPWVRHLAADPTTRSNTSVCLAFADPAVPAERQAGLAKAIAQRLEAEGAAYDIGAYRDAPPGLRIWCGSTVETSDLDALMPWLDWAYRSETEMRT